MPLAVDPFWAIVYSINCKYSFSGKYMDNDKFDLSGKDDDQMIDLVYGTLETLCSELESRGFAPDVIDATMFIFWQQRMFEADAREDFEDILREALEDDWPEGPTIH